MSTPTPEQMARDLATIMRWTRLFLAFAAVWALITGVQAATDHTWVLAILNVWAGCALANECRSMTRRLRRYPRTES